MRKHLFLFLFLVATLGAQSIVLADNLGNVSLAFCDTTGNILTYTIEPDTTTDVCYTLTNGSQQNLIIRTNFVDGTYNITIMVNDTAGNHNFTANGTIYALRSILAKIISCG